MEKRIYEIKVTRENGFEIERFNRFLHCWRTVKNVNTRQALIEAFRAKGFEYVATFEYNFETHNLQLVAGI